MALRRRTSTPQAADRRYDELTAALLAEWRDPSDDPDAEPLIVIERDDSRDPVRRVWVVWSAWEDLTPPQRVQVVRNAYEQFLGDDQADLEQLEHVEGLLPGEVPEQGNVPV